MENPDNLVIIMKNCSFNAKANCMCDGTSLDDFLIDEANIIDNNDIILDAVGHYNGDELE